MGLISRVGMALFLVVAGFMMMLSIFSVFFVAIFLAIGFVLLAWRIRFLKWKEIQLVPRNVALKVGLLGFCLLGGLSYAAAVSMHWYNTCDDFAAYFAHTKMLLDTGTMSDPFSFRLLGSLGGQQTLSTLVMAFLPWKYAHLLDAGVALLIMLGLTQEMVRGNTNKAWTTRLLILAFALTFFMPRANSASELTGVVLFLALLRTFDLVISGRLVGWRSALLLAGVITAVATLRCHNVFVVGLLGACFVVCRVAESSERRHEIIRNALRKLALVIVLSAPWWIVTYRSSGAFLYPLLKGTQSPEFEMYKIQLTAMQALQFITGFFVSTNYLLLFLPVLLLQRGREQKTLLVYGGAILLISIACVSQLTNSQYSDLYRYLGPIALAFGLHTIGVVAPQFLAAPAYRGARYPIAITLAGAVLVFQGTFFVSTTVSNIALIVEALNANKGLSNFGIPVSVEEAKKDYQEAFTQIPPDGKTLIALDYPFLLDYHAHRIFNIDVTGAASPAPGFPYFHGAGPVKQYLLAQGIRYIAHVPFDHSNFLYSRNQQRENLIQSDSVLYRYLATFQIDFFDNIEQLAGTNRILYNSPTIQVIDLNN